VHAGSLEVGNRVARLAAFKADHFEADPRQLSAEQGAHQANPDQDGVRFSG
jgi:hypothetical protein